MTAAGSVQALLGERKTGKGVAGPVSFFSWTISESGFIISCREEERRVSYHNMMRLGRRVYHKLHPSDQFSLFPQCVEKRGNLGRTIKDE